MLKYLALLSATIMSVPTASTAENQTTPRGAVLVFANEIGIRIPTLTARSRGTVALFNGEVVVITAGHSIDVSSRDTQINNVWIQIGRTRHRATSWNSLLGSERDIGYLHFDAATQEILRPLARELAASNAESSGTLLYADGARENTSICQMVTVRRNMVLSARSDDLHPRTRVDYTARCDRLMAENSLSGASLLNPEGQIVGIFFADIESHTEMNAAFSKV